MFNTEQKLRKVWFLGMDRRQKKTRECIFKAFTNLLSKKSFDKITVGEIIEIADIGRATFYAHFPTKDFLLKDLCEELFLHLFDTEVKPCNDKKGVFYCDDYGSVFLHLFKHIKHNDNNLLKLLSGENNELFFRYFKDGVKMLVEKHILDFRDKKPSILPNDFWINHITSTFIETLKWWIDKGLTESPEVINEYFFSAV